MADIDYAKLIEEIEAHHPDLARELGKAMLGAKADAYFARMVQLTTIDENLGRTLLDQYMPQIRQRNFKMSMARYDS